MHSMTPESLETNQFLPLLVSLSRLRITIGKWDYIPVPLRTSIQLTLARPTLTCLELNDFDGFPLVLLMHCRALRSLTLNMISFESDFESTVAASGSPRARLEHLSLHLTPGNTLDFVHWILLEKSPIDLSCLRSLASDIYVPFSALQRLLTASAPSLQQLRLVQHWQITAGILDFSGLSQLHTLSFDVRAPVEPRMRSLAPSLVLPQTEMTFALVLNVWTYNTRPESVQLVDTDRMLANLSCITSVTVTLLRMYHPKDRLIDVSDAFKREMPLLANRLRAPGAFRVLQSVKLGN
ncbi:hypothetical protein C8R45DRAFT_348912 [Mycena sanguinolenta]|nr:hypothetical protein C8R45DRAFT_348912 [Mycena sanguinolenta]